MKKTTLYINYNKMPDAFVDAYNEFDEHNKTIETCLYRYPHSTVGCHLIYQIFLLNDDSWLVSVLRLTEGEHGEYFKKWKELKCDEDDKRLKRYMSDADIDSIYDFPKDTPCESIAKRLFHDEDVTEPFTKWLQDFKDTTNLSLFSSRLESFENWLDENKPELYKEYHDKKLYSSLPLTNNDVEIIVK